MNCTGTQQRSKRKVRKYSISPKTKRNTEGNTIIQNHQHKVILVHTQYSQQTLTMNYTSPEHLQYRETISNTLHTQRTVRTHNYIKYTKHQTKKSMRGSHYSTVLSNDI